MSQECLFFGVCFPEIQGRLFTCTLSCKKRMIVDGSAKIEGEQFHLSGMLGSDYFFIEFIPSVRDSGMNSYRALLSTQRNTRGIHEGIMMRSGQFFNCFVARYIVP